jgi:predicted HTH transcriptional regulator
MARRSLRKGHEEEQDPAVTKALAARRESKAVEFKSEFNPASRGAWCEILKDILAIANSGGGVIAFGIEGAGRPTGADLSNVLGLDPAEVTDKVHAYTGVHFADFEIIDAIKDGRQVAMLVIEPQKLQLSSRKPAPTTQAVASRRQHLAKAPYTSGMVRKANPELLPMSQVR